MKTRLLALLLVFIMVLGMLPVSAFAAETESQNYELKVLTFEDADYKGGTNYANGTNWSSLIDSAQYSGSLLYPTDATTAYNWYDEGNTYLKHAFADEWGDHQYWGGGHAISNYNSADFTTYGTYEHQLTVYNAAASGLATTGGGHNGSNNFAIHFGYVDDSGYSGTIQQSLTFGDGVARVIDHMYVNNTTYAMNCFANGNELTENIRETDWVKLIATGHHADGTTATAELYLVNGPSNIVKDWTKWDLSGLGAVTKVEFNVTGTNDNGYGFSQPGYFAYDDVAVRFEKEVTEHTCADSDGDKKCDTCDANLNKLPTLIEGVEDVTQVIQTGLSYQLMDLTDGKIFTDEDDTLTYESYFYRKSSDGGETWGELTGFSEMEHGGFNNSVANSEEGTYIYEFVAYDGYGYSEDTWTLTLITMDVVPANVSFYVGQDQNYKTNGSILPVLELYRTAGIDEDFYDYVGWFTNAEGTIEYVYNPADYEIVDGETDYVVIEGKQYALHDYEKITFTNSAFDDTDTTATASGTEVNGYNMFYATVTTGRYSTRAYGYNTETSAYDIYLGGQSMELPREVDIYGNGGDNIYLRVVSVYTTAKKIDGTYFTADDYYAEMIMPVTGSMIHSGDPYVSGNYTYFPFMSWAAGNGSLYNYYVYPYDTDNYIFSQAINATTSAGTTVVNKSLSISAAVELKVTVPANGDFGLYFQYNNFNTKVMEPVGEAVVNEDGTKTITYKVSKSNQNYTWRLADPTGTYVTKASWLAGLSAATEKTITFSEFTNKKSHDFSNLGTTVKNRDEADLQVFLSDSGFRSVSGETRIRAYRMWQLINSDPGNIMVEPDFNIQVLQGNASDITLSSGGNALNNWIDVTPTTTDIVAVNYDALEAIHTTDAYSSHGGLFPATNPERTNVFIITNQTAGTADAHVSFNGSKETDRGTEWDYNYDTWFYLNTDENPMLDFTVTGTGTVDVSYATVITNASGKSTLSGWTTLTAGEDGCYDVSLLPFRNAGTKGGTVIIRMTDSTGTSYRLVRVAEMTANVTNASNPGEPFMPGDDATITFDGLYRSINKISGIFNPTTYYLRYTVNGTEVNGSLGQYLQMDKTSIMLTIPEDITFPEGETTVDYSFTNGYVFGSMYAASSPFQSMYYITDTGVGTNFSAVGVSFVLSRMADIPITVQQKVSYDMKLNVTDGETALTDYTFTLSDPDGNALTPDENGIYQDLGYGEYTYTLSKRGYVGQNGTLKLGSADAENVIDGILIKTIVAVKAAEGAWDGVTVTEPAAVDGVYQIGTGAELAWFAQTVNAGTTGISAVLTADIDLACYNWTPIGNYSQKFAGTFDGNGYRIYNLSIINTAATSNTGYGLFGYGASCTISNLTIAGNISLTSSSSVATAYVSGVLGGGTSVTISNTHSEVDITITRVKGNWARVGGVFGGGSANAITNCSNSGTIQGYQYVGGVVGYTSAGTISGCFNSGNLSGYQYIGGIVGSNAGGNTMTSYNTGNVTASNTYAGGIAATSAGGQLMNCFNTGAVSGSNYTGGVAGNISKATATVSNVYYLEGTCVAGLGKVTGEHTAEVVSADTFASADFVTTINTGLETAAFVAGTDHPILVWQVSSEEPVKGDIDGDGKINAMDAAMIYKFVKNNTELTEEQLSACDMNGDGKINALDAALIYKLVATK